MHDWTQRPDAKVPVQHPISGLWRRLADHALCSLAVRFLSFCLILLVFALAVSAQTGTGGTLLGTVTDPSGAVMPNVGITITNTDTNQTTHLTTNQGGEYVAADLPIGHYVVRAETSGFKASEQRDIALSVGARSRVDIKLEVGNTQQSVTVEATAVAV